MANTETQSMPREKFLTMSINLLHRAFIESTRTEAKKLFKFIEQGQTVALTEVRMENDSTVRVDVALDHSEFGGSLNYGAFRTSLTALLGNLAKAINEEREIQTFGAENDPNSMIFGVTGVTLERSVPAVMVLSSGSSDREARIVLRLMYLDYKQFEASQKEGQVEQLS